jgi:hypothetical protein
MRNNKKILGTIFLLALVCTIAYGPLKAVAADGLTYVPLVNLATGGAGGTKTDLGTYISQFFTVFQGLIVFLAVVYITIGGIFLMMSGDNSGLNTKGKSYITEALWGLGIMLCANLILGTINPRLISPDLLNFKDKITKCQLNK